MISARSYLSLSMGQNAGRTRDLPLGDPDGALERVVPVRDVVDEPGRGDIVLTVSRSRWEQDVRSTFERKRKEEVREREREREKTNIVDGPKGRGAASVTGSHELLDPGLTIGSRSCDGSADSVAFSLERLEVLHKWTSEDRRVSFPCEHRRREHGARKVGTREGRRRRKRRGKGGQGGAYLDPHLCTIFRRHMCLTLLIGLVHGKDVLVGGEFDARPVGRGVFLKVGFLA
jgi:hypothetical protein